MRNLKRILLQSMEVGGHLGAFLTLALPMFCRCLCPGCCLVGTILLAGCRG